MKPEIYIAAPLFSAAEKSWNLVLENMLARYFRTFLPQRDGGLVVDGEPTEKVFSVDRRVLEKCDVLLAILDGRSVDEGVAWELGYAYAKHKICVGLQTDPRRLLLGKNNPMVDCSLSIIFPDLLCLEEWAEKFRVF